MAIKLNDSIISFLLEKLRLFHQNTPLALEHQALYDKIPVQQLVEVLLRAYGDSTEGLEAARTLASQMLEHQIPYVVIMGDINTLKNALVAYHKNDCDNPYELMEEADVAFEKIKNEIAKVYLHKIIADNGVIPHKSVENKILIQIYQDWFTLFQKAVLESDLDAFKKIAEINQYFLQAVRYPESLMVCLDANACDEVNRMHLNIMRQSKLLYAKLIEGDYVHAYILFNELQVSVKQLAALLVTLYYNYETNKLGAFFQFLEAVCNLDNRVFLTLMNIKGLGRINKLKGEEIGDRTISTMNDLLDQFVANHRDRLACIKGVSGDFYLLSLSTKVEQIKAYIADLQAQLSQKLGDKIEFSVVSVNMNLLKNLSRANLRRTVVKLHDIRSDEALYLSDKKAVGALEKSVAKDLQQSVDISNLLEKGSIDIALQPIMALDQSAANAIAFEVLGRIKSDKGLLSAGIFIDTLIELKLADELDRLMLRKVCDNIDRLKEITDTLFLNISPVSLNNVGYIEMLTGVIQNELLGMNIVLELTEQTLLERVDTVKSLSQEKGLVFAIDDFGSGYSSLMTVIDLASSGAVRYLKIDGSLTKDIIDSPQVGFVFDIISDLSHSLKIHSVAEFVENPQIKDKLAESNITYGQGYYLGRPNTIEYWLVEVLGQKMLAAGE